MAERWAEGRRPALLALAFADIAAHLHAAESYDDVLTRIAAAALGLVTGAEAASVSVRRGQCYRTVGATSRSALQVDQAQYDAAEGPCLEAASISPVVSAPSFPDERWPLLGATPTTHGVHSSISYQLFPRRGAAMASLNIYGPAPHAFDDAAVEIGSILASHASVAARAVLERASLHLPDRDFQQALMSRDVIGQAKGILMERFKTTPEQAFEILKSTSQRSNLKLREVARRLAESGEIQTE